MVSGASPGPAPAAQARASSSRVTRSSWRAWPQRKLRRNVPRVDGAFTVQPSTRPVPPERSASASSMQSPPASAEATRVSSLSPAFARPGAAPRSRWASVSSRRPSRSASVAGSSRPAWSTRRSSSKAIRSRSGVLGVSIEGVLPVSGAGFVQNPLSQIQRSTPSQLLTHSPSVDRGLALRGGGQSRETVRTPTHGRG